MGRTIVKRFFWLILALVGLVAGPAPAEEKFRAFASVGTGALNGVYYPIGGAICAIVNDHIRATGVRCSPETTPGSVYNADALRSGELEFAIVQSDVAFDAYNRKGGPSDNPFRELRSVLALHPELVTLVGRGGIHEISDLVGKRINVGPEGSGSRRTWETLQQALGWEDAQAPQLVDMPADAIGAPCALAQSTPACSWWDTLRLELAPLWPAAPSTSSPSMGRLLIPLSRGRPTGKKGRYRGTSMD